MRQEAPAPYGAGMRSLVPILAGALALTACGSEPREAPLQVTHAWVRLPAFATSPGAAYFTVHGGPEADTLERISSPNAARIDLHGPGMRPLGPQAVPAGGELVFAPAGRHAMLFWNGAPAVSRERVPLTLHFRSGRDVTVRAVAVPLGMADPEFVDGGEQGGECVEDVRQDANRIVATNCG